MAASPTVQPPQRLVSAGGVVYRKTEHGIEVIICGRREDSFWALPKGTPEAGERLDHTAVREVEEETGLKVAIERKLGSIRYQFTSPDGLHCVKRVEHHLMTPTGGSLLDHDGEFDEVGWFPIDAALRLLRYPNEREIVRRAARLIEQRGE